MQTSEMEAGLLPVISSSMNRNVSVVFETNRNNMTDSGFLFAYASDIPGMEVRDGKQQTAACVHLPRTYVSLERMSTPIKFHFSQQSHT